MTTHFICPVCGKPLVLREGTLVCTAASPRPHSFDLSRHGYVNLLTGSHRESGDPREMVLARSEFLRAGSYAPVADAVAGEAAKSGGVLLDAGCGEGYYTERLAAVCREAIGIDLSREAVTAAARFARKNPAVGDRLSYAVAGIFHLPLADASCDTVTNLFAPCAEEEFARVLKPGGLLILAGAGAEHLMGLKRALYETTYENTARADLPKMLSPVLTRTVDYEITLHAPQIYNLFTMTPYFYRTPPEAVATLKERQELTTRVQVNIAVYRKE